MTTTIPPTLLGQRTGAIRLGAELGDGAAGTVFIDRDDPSTVIKVFKKDKLTSETRLRMRAMVARAIPPRDPRFPETMVAWPSELILERGEVSGIRIPRALGPRAEILHSFANVRAREKDNIDAPFQTLAWIAHNVALAVQRAHELHLVVGDINESNFMASANGAVTLIDTDSVLFVDQRGARHGTPFHKPQFLAPELSGASEQQLLRRTQSHDEHALAVLLFMILMGGFHPFDGRSVAGERQSDRARSGRFAYPGTIAGLQPPPNAPPWSVLPGALQREFTKTFTRGMATSRPRTSALQWTQALRSALLVLRTCPRNGHQYPAEATRCPWCDHERERSGRFTRPTSAAQPQPQAPLRPPSQPAAARRAPAPVPRTPPPTLAARFGSAVRRHPAVSAALALAPVIALALILGLSPANDGAAASGAGAPPAAASTPKTAKPNGSGTKAQSTSKAETSRAAKRAKAKRAAAAKAKAKRAAAAKAKRAAAAKAKRAAAAKARRQAAAQAPPASTPKAQAPSSATPRSSTPARSGGGLGGQAKPGSGSGSGSGGLSGSAGADNTNGLSGSAGGN